ncbi:hypothetical protein KJ877_08505 [bacterium]|nr:hypothetical protein [bacterium]MBU1990737.1 hypothetical protein [bacterium]
MFVSSYSTYINTNSSARNDGADSQKVKKEPSFGSGLSEKQTLSFTDAIHLPVDYIAKKSAFWHKLELQKKEAQNTQKDIEQKTKEFTQHKTLQNAQKAYTENSKIFSLFLKANPTLDQTPKIDKKLPKDIQDLKEKNIRHTMVNTYLSNDRYYQLTA